MALATAALLVSGPAAASPFPTRQGEQGLLDVPTADVSGPGGGQIGGELRLDRSPGRPTSFGPLPLGIGFGILRNLDGAFSLREGGYPGDRQPAPLAYSAALKYRLVPASGLWPGLAVGATLDSFNTQGKLGARLIASTAELGRIRFAAFAGAEGHGPRPVSVGPTGGLAAAVILRSDLETVVEGLAGPRGALVGAALRWSFTPKLGISLGASWVPRDNDVRFSLGFGLAAAPPAKRRGPAAPAAPPEKVVEAAPQKPTGPVFLDERPRMRMRIVSLAASRPGEPRHLQYGPYSDAGRSSPTARPARIEPADAQQARAQELSGAAEGLGSRERRLRAAEAALASRMERATAERAALEERDRQLAAHSRAVEARERQMKAAGKASEKEVAIAHTEEKFRAQEAELAGREAAANEELSRTAARLVEAARREEQLAPPLSRAQAAEVRSKGSLDAQAAAVEARQAWLSALEERLSATRARIEASERSNELFDVRLGAVERRLANTEDRLALLDKRLRVRAAAPPPLPAAPAATSVPEAAPAEPAASPRAVAAATVVQLAAPDAPVAALDREAVEGLARLAAREERELLVWARAANPGLMEQAARRAEELKAVAVAAGLPAARVTTRVTLRPSTQGIDVVVSALQPDGPAGAGR